MPKKTIGILGGMGPEATADLFLKIIRATPARTDQEHIRVLIDNNPAIPDRTAAILGRGPDPVPLLTRTARLLEQWGADLIVIPCNTAHYFHDQVQASVHVPVLHIMKETAAFLRERYPGLSAVGVLATTGTVRTGLYQRFLGERGLHALVPDDEGQQEVMDCIYGEHGVKAGHTGPEVTERLVRVAQSLVARGAGAVIAGCTELPIVLHDGDLPVPVIDPTRILAEAAVRAALE
ncbi:MAG: amino acid racemase [Symbiobacterium sp.]|uniref:aspartate/glutamate racemase family protein n=1 Tax=Symbiobacterium sp. TaxID=1971213 RepID=UPI003464BC94